MFRAHLAKSNWIKRTMVNLSVLSARNVREDEEGKWETTKSNLVWGIRYGRSLEEVKRREEPTGLLELEKLALRGVKLIGNSRANIRKSHNEAMDLLRQQHNLNFIVLCEKCGGSHASDELSAPER